MENKMEVLDKFKEMTINSWTYARLTTEEVDRLNKILESNTLKKILKYSDNHKWEVLHEIYHAFLEGCGYDGQTWRDK